MSIGLTLRYAARSRTVRLLGSSIGFGGGGGATGAGGGGAGLTAVGAGVTTAFVTTGFVTTGFVTAGFVMMGRAVGTVFGAGGRIGGTGLTGTGDSLAGAGAAVVIVARALETGTVTEVGLVAGAVGVTRVVVALAVDLRVEDDDLLSDDFVFFGVAGLVVFFAVAIGHSFQIECSMLILVGAIDLKGRRSRRPRGTAGPRDF